MCCIPAHKANRVVNYLQLRFEVSATPTREMLLAQLSAAGFTAFEEGDNYLVAGIGEADFKADATAAIANQAGIRYTVETLPETNWNAMWEASFEPVIVAGFCAIRAGFHPPMEDLPYEVVITPKMSFGTGHHATTRLMMEAMRGIDFSGRRVLDFGTGTAILAILARKLGADTVLAIDNDSWSVENAAENVAANNAHDVQVVQGSLEAATGVRFGIILANINRHILLQYMASFPTLMEPGGVLLLSGILTEDRYVVQEAASEAGLRFTGVFTEAGWLAIFFSL